MPALNHAHRTARPVTIYGICEFVPFLRENPSNILSDSTNLAPRGCGHERQDERAHAIRIRLHMG
jgi:hypothetical protein